jgi:hypothetical protein
LKGEIKRKKLLRVRMRPLQIKIVEMMVRNVKQIITAFIGDPPKNVSNFLNAPRIIFAVSYGLNTV